MDLNLPTNFHRYQRYFVNIGRLYKIKKVRVYTEIVLSLLAISFFLAFAIKPTLITIAELVKTINDQKMITDQLQNKINALALAQSEYNLVSSDLYLVDEALPKNSQISGLAIQIEALAQQAGIVLGSVRFDPIPLKENRSPKKTEIAFNLTASGDFQNLKSFLRLLNSLRRVIQVETFSFKIKGAESEALLLGLGGKAYYLGGENEK